MRCFWSFQAAVTHPSTSSTMTAICRFAVEYFREITDALHWAEDKDFRCLDQNEERFGWHRSIDHLLFEDVILDAVIISYKHYREKARFHTHSAECARLLSKTSMTHARLSLFLAKYSQNINVVWSKSSICMSYAQRFIFAPQSFICLRLALTWHARDLSVPYRVLIHA